MTERIDIGIDGGGTGCRVVVARGEARVGAEGGPANVVTDAAGAEASIREALIGALGKAGLGLDDLGEARIVAGLAGCRLPGVADAFATRLPYLAYVVDDSITALEGAFSGRFGTLVNLGTGSFLIRRDERGVTHQGGWGLHLGDEGSAAWLGRLALAQMMRIEDGRLAVFSADALVPTLQEACGTHPVLFAAEAGPEDFAALAPAILAAETPFARALLAQVRDVLARGLADIGHPEGTDWALTGGFGQALAETGAEEDLPPGRIKTEGTALDGALAMARALP